MTKSCQVFRPFYINSERLYDMYSTMMNGYSNIEDVVEIRRGSKQKGGTLGASIGARFSSIVKGSIDGTLNSTTTSDKEVQLKTKVELSACVLLNRLIFKLAEGADVLKMEVHNRLRSHHNIHRSIGQPLLLEGCIVPNTIRDIKKLDIGKTNRKEISKYLHTKLFTLFHQKQNYFLDNRLFEERNLLLRSAVIFDHNLEEFIEYLQHVHDSEENHDYINSIIEKKNNFSQYLSYYDFEYDTAYMCLTDLKMYINNIMKKLNVSGEKQDTQHSFTKALTHFDELLSRSINHFQEINPKGVLKINESIDYCYTFYLEKSMYYDASESDILAPTYVKCLGLIRNPGSNMCEIEVVAIYQ